MSAEISLSLCICTRHRPNDLRRALQSIADSSRQPDQVIVSDDSNDGQTSEHVAAAFPFVEYQRGPGMGLGANRNACLNHVRSSFVSFIDDDVVLPPSFTLRAYQLCQANAGLRSVPIISGTEVKHFSKEECVRVEPANADFWGFQRVKPTTELKAVVINAGIFPTELFRKAKFDPKLRYGSDEIDMIRHAVSLGYRVEFHPDLWVDHFPSQINREEYKSLVDASRMYSTAKDYWLYQRNLGRTLVFCLLAPPKLAIGQARRAGIKGLLHAARATRLALAYGFGKTPA